jgi:diguanylate cyclase (GGDEF)-like protein
MPEFTRSEARAIAERVGRFADAFRRDVGDVLAAQFRGCQPPEVAEVSGQLAILQRQLEANDGSGKVKVHDGHAALLKRLILSERRRVAEEIDLPLQRAVDGQLIRMLRREIGSIEYLMEAPWFDEVAPQRLPQLTDYLSIRHAEVAALDLGLAPRAYDEKFHILEAPSLFLPDLGYYRRRCAFRGLPIAVAFLDIDDFKEFNTRHTETTVDLNLLVPFMEAIEAHVFSHGHAYRFGGDEYMLTLPNQDGDAAASFLRALQARISRAPYRGMYRAPTVSIGLAVVDTVCFLTDREVQARSNLAKNHAKKTKKGAIASFGGMLFREADLGML